MVLKAMRSKTVSRGGGASSGGRRRNSSLGAAASGPSSSSVQSPRQPTDGVAEARYAEMAFMLRKAVAMRGHYPQPAVQACDDTM